MRVRSIEELGLVVKDARRRAGLSQLEVAQRAGVQRTWLSRLESGHANPTFDTLLRVLTAVGLSFDVVAPDAAPGDTRPHGVSVNLVSLLNRLRHQASTGPDDTRQLTQALAEMLLTRGEQDFTPVPWPDLDRSSLHAVRARALRQAAAFTAAPSGDTGHADTVTSCAAPGDLVPTAAVPTAGPPVAAEPTDDEQFDRELSDDELSDDELSDDVLAGLLGMG